MSVSKLCRRAGMSPQNFYRARRSRQRKSVDADFIETLVRRERAMQPRLGGRKLYYMLKPEMKKAGVDIGRDLFFNVLRDKGLLVERLPRAPRTTNSNHSLPVFRNLIADMIPSAPNQIWAGDITCIRTDCKFLYLSLITDMYSRKIVGWHLSADMTADETLNALNMAPRGKPADVKPIHHSDRGSQYCSHVYAGKLKGHGISISMTEDNHCAENALAERINGILKQEYGLGSEFRNAAQAYKAVKQAIALYNCRRPHTELKMKTPEQVHSLAA